MNRFLPLILVVAVATLGLPSLVQSDVTIDEFNNFQRPGKVFSISSGTRFNTISGAGFLSTFRTLQYTSVSESDIQIFFAGTIHDSQSFSTERLRVIAFESPQTSARTTAEMIVLLGYANTGIATDKVPRLGQVFLNGTESGGDRFLLNINRGLDATVTAKMNICDEVACEEVDLGDILPVASSNQNFFILFSQFQTIDLSKITNIVFEFHLSGDSVSGSSIVGELGMLNFRTNQSDQDGDGVPDALDAFPLDASETLDSDGDGMGDNFEGRFEGLDASDSNDAALDNDGDGATNLEEFQAGTNPTVNEPAVTTIINTILLGEE